MSRIRRLEVYQSVLSSGVVPIFYQGEPRVAEAVVSACIEGGAQVVELTNRGDHALKVFAHLSEYLESIHSPVALGVGSIVDAPTAAIFIAHGADFIVSPNYNPEVARLCNRRMIPYLPGCATVSEISDAQEMGAEIIKVFPGETLGGPAMIKAVLGPLPWSRLMPTGGVELSREDVFRWIKAGAACLGMGSNLVRKDWVAAGNYDAIRDAVGNVIQWVQEARQ
jgi:2-dehydro-3-deoxyphosphogluconate aldolase/(4S)-4-hydroxy-2-oxoglutarate aldolase